MRIGSYAHLFLYPPNGSGGHIPACGISACIFVIRIYILITYIIDRPYISKGFQTCPRSGLVISPGGDPWASGVNSGVSSPIFTPSTGFRSAAPSGSFNLALLCIFII